MGGAGMPPLRYKALVNLNLTHLETDGHRYPLGCRYACYRRNFTRTENRDGIPTLASAKGVA